MRTFLGRSDFYWPLMVLAETVAMLSVCQCPSLSRVLFLLCSYIFLQTDGLQTDGSRLLRAKGPTQAGEKRSFAYNEHPGSGPNTCLRITDLNPAGPGAQRWFEVSCCRIS